MSLELPPHGGSPLGPTPPNPAGNFAVTPALAALPAPRHLHEYLTRSQHLHLGYFEAPADSLTQAQERLIVRAGRMLTRGSLVADVGCGLGGAVHWLAAQGHRVYGIDPCAASIGYARVRTGSTRAQFLVADLAQFAARARGARFDAMFLTEVLPHFRDLGALFGHCRAILRPGGLVLVHDVVRRLSPEGGAFDFHGRGALRAAADAAGFDALESRDLSQRMSPTLPRLLRALNEREEELTHAFGASRPALAREIQNYRERLRALELGFAREELVYEASVLRCSTRLGSDSVVLRVPLRATPVPVHVPAPRPS
jgi:cyclopropane fatty-acyl-phospholipid synthase-like methyltransferase